MILPIKRLTNITKKLVLSW